ncbi:MAG TPA: tetratricopeptide repeat protein [Gemmataceae bacterium]|nr:tetratricopeptide repeat protein [Gemmataceae bacterium]
MTQGPYIGGSRLVCPALDLLPAQIAPVHHRELVMDAIGNGADLLAIAERFHTFGGFEQAAQLYEQALQQQPGDPAVWGRLGKVWHALGRHDQAAACYRQALELQPHDGGVYHNLGAVLLLQGRLDEAAACCREALRLQPGYAEAHNNLGAALLAGDLPGEAVTCFREALRLRPEYAAAHRNLGNALARQGELEEAAASYRRAVELQPHDASEWVHLASALGSLGQWEEATACYERALKLRPGDPGVLNELAAVRMRQGRLAEAVDYYEQTLRIRPDAAGLYNNLGLALLKQGRTREAMLSFCQVLYLQPELAEAHNNLGMALLNQDRKEEAVLRFQQALALRPDLADAHNNLGLARAAQGFPDDAFGCYQQALQVEPDHIGALANLGNAYKDQGRLAEAVACYRDALRSRPHDAKIHSNLILALNYQPGTDAQAILCEARRYAAVHAAPLAAAIKSFQPRPLAGRRLRIGYVSADYREHPVAYFLEPILASHDRRNFEIFCYADVLEPDATTQHLQGYADHWRSLVGVSDTQAAEAIYQDGIDILVDLAGHTGGNRLLAFALKPAPIQASYLGYLGTTGLPTIDYYITDADADPPGLTEADYEESLIRLPQCAFCYRPGTAPETGPDLPARQAGGVTFGCLNSLAKVSEENLALWARVLEAVPGSRLLLRAGAGRQAEHRVRDAISRHAIAPDRLIFLENTPSRFDYLKLYQAVDLCLDPFPYNGVTTTCDALWMGIPVVSLAGRRSVSRQGVRFLRSVGLQELIAETPEAYVRIAAGLAGDLPQLTALRRGLRERMSRSPLMDSVRLTHQLEDAYRAMRDER